MFTFLGVLFYFIIGIIIGNFCVWLASTKGYSSTSWLWLGIFFGIIPLIVLVGAPDKNLRSNIEELNSNISKLQLK